MIKRDGSLQSLWQGTVDEYPSKPLQRNNAHYDVIVAGGGITGISTAFLLQQSGKNCLVVEADNLCFGTTGGTTAHLNTLLDVPYTTIRKNFGQENASLVAKSVKEAIELIRNNISSLNIDCGFKETSAYLFAQNEQQQKELEEIYEANNAVGVQSDYVSSLPYSFPFQKAIEVKGQAKFIPTKYVFALAKAFEDMGGSIIQQCRVTGVQNNDTVTVQTTNGDYSANALVYATHIPPAVNLLHLRCVPYRSYAMAVSLKDNFPDNLFYDMYDPYHYYRTQEIDGKTYLIGGGYDHKTAHEPNTNSCFLQLEAHMRETFEVDEVNYKWSSQYFEPADGIPYIGHLPGVSKNIYVATGYGGNGMVYSSVAAILLTKIINSEEAPYKDLYHPGRIKPIAGFTTFIQHNADVVKQFAGKLFDAEKLPELADLAPGEGRLVSYEKQKIALYKDDNGKLYAVNPVCTHLKCDVKWNVAEKSWDCPCHGARYDINGKVLTGPADRDLEQVEIKSV